MYLIDIDYLYSMIAFAESRFEGSWINENGGQKIECEMVNHTLQCTWPNQTVEHFQLNTEILRGVAKPEILGYPTDDGMITWNTGNRWIRPGNC